MSVPDPASTILAVIVQVLSLYVRFSNTMRCFMEQCTLIRTLNKCIVFEKTKFEALFIRNCYSLVNVKKYLKHVITLFFAPNLYELSISIIDMKDIGAFYRSLLRAFSVF